MKCDELQSVYIDRTGDWVRSGNNTGKFYLKDEVNASIEELKDAWKHEHNCCEALKAKLENVQASTYADSVDAGMRERRLKRALYKACANWALSTLAWLDCIDQGEPRKWSEMIQKCRAKAEEYK